MPHPESTTAQVGVWDSQSKRAWIEGPLSDATDTTPTSHSPSLQSKHSLSDAPTGEHGVGAITRWIRGELLGTTISSVRMSGSQRMDETNMAEPGPHAIVPSRPVPANGAAEAR